MTEIKQAATLEQLGFNLAPQEESNKWEGQLSILAGPPKVGKSTFLAQGGEKTWFIRLAPEFQDLKTYGVDCREWNDVNREVDRLWKAKKAGLFKWETIVFDPGDKLLEFVADHICEEESAPSIFEVAGYGVGQRKYKMALKGFLSNISQLPAHIFFCFHTRDKELSEPNDDKKKYHRWVLDISEKLDAEFPKRVHNVLNIMTGYVGTHKTRALITQGTKYIEAGCKAPCLKKIERIDWGEDDAKNYREFRARFQ